MYRLEYTMSVYQSSDGEAPAGADLKPIVGIRDAGRPYCSTLTALTSSEEQVEKIDHRLYRLENTLNELVHNDRRSCGQGAPFSLSPASDASSSLKVAPRQPTPSVDEMSYQGESSFETHSKEASEFLENTLQSSSASVLKQDASTALGSLRTSFKPHRPPGSSNFRSDLPMPPLHLAVKTMRLCNCTSE